MLLPVKTSQSSYMIRIEAGCTNHAGEHLDLDRKVLIVTDSGVPAEYAARIAKMCKEPVIHCVPMGEGSKSISVWQELLQDLLHHGFTRSDCVVAVGGGVVGDLAGFTAASYMRGIDFYNIPTTVLSQVDSSIGGKTAVNFEGIKNIVGAFYPPKAVLIDTDLLKSLPDRQIANGLAESVKMALTCDAELFELFEQYAIGDILPTVIERSIAIKKRVVESDEKETGMRKILNFGHTIGHGIESFEELCGLYHGECVALGMLPMCSDAVRARLIPVLRKLGLPTTCSLDMQRVYEAMTHDKKTFGSKITVTTVEKVGTYTMQVLPITSLADRLHYFAENSAGGTCQ